MYYHLHEHCRLVTGALRGAIYDLNAQKVYSINQSALDLLKRSPHAPLDQILADEQGEMETHQLQLQFLDDLTKKNLGGCYFSPRANTPLNEPPPNAELPLDFAWLELTPKCNNRCLHCYTASSPEQNNDRIVSLKAWLNAIDDLKEAGATGIQLIGGEPLLYPHWRTLVLKARQKKFDFIEIFTNATTITDDDIHFFSREQVCIATTLYADHAEIHDEITQNKGSFEKTVRAIQKMVQRRIPLRIASIVMKNNEHLAKRIPEFCASLGVEGQPPDVVRPTGRGGRPELMPKLYRRPPIAPPFFVNEMEFSLAKYYNPCLAGKIAIAANGDVLPCIFARDRIFGNLLAHPLPDILKSAALRECWQTNKDKVDKCKCCEYRYACPDCRIAAQSADKDRSWTAAPPDCGYDPQSGTWS